MANGHPPSTVRRGPPRGRSLGVLLIGLATFAAATVSGQDIERDPINYSAATPRNAVARLQGRLATGTAKLEFEPEHGYLRSLLRALDVPESSQVLVFSKTSLQRERISPKTPRAIYFNDDVMVGFCLRGQVIEISAADDALGTAFYTLDQEPRGEAASRDGRRSRACSATAPRPTRGSPGTSSVPLFVGPAGQCRSCPAGRSAPTTRARSPSAGGAGT